MKAFVLTLLTVPWLLIHSVQAQSLVQRSLRLRLLQGYFLTDSIDVGRPFQYALTYRHPPTVDVLFPDTAHHFIPYQVQNVAIFATETVGAGPDAVSRDSAVYTLVSFETDSVQLLQVPIRLLNATDCTTLLTPTDTVFLRSLLTSVSSGSAGPQAFTLATTTTLAPLQQQFNYPVLAVGVLAVGVLAGLLYGLFGRFLQRQWRLYQLNRRHIRFLRQYDRLSRDINARTAAETANQAVILWKTYLEKLDRQPYASLTTPELAERMNDERITNALRETDRMMYGGAFSPQSQSALQVLGDVATQTYQRCRAQLRASVGQPVALAEEPSPAESSSVS